MRMAVVAPGGMGGPTLWMAIKARDQTGDTFKRVENKIGRIANMAVQSMNRIGSLAMSFATLGRVTGMLTDEQARMIGVFGTVIRIFTTGYYVAKTVATAVTWAHNTALTWEVALMTLGVGVAIAAAAAIAVLAMQTREAAGAQRSYNTELEKGTRLQQRRTANRNLVRRGEFEEVI